MMCSTRAYLPPTPPARTVRQRNDTNVLSRSVSPSPTPNRRRTDVRLRRRRRPRPRPQPPARLVGCARRRGAGHACGANGRARVPFRPARPRRRGLAVPVKAPPQPHTLPVPRPDRYAWMIHLGEKRRRTVHWLLPCLEALYDPLGGTYVVVVVASAGRLASYRMPELIMFGLGCRDTSIRCNYASFPFHPSCS